MINGMSGRPGAGKSYECVTRHIIPALEQGRKIITNIPLQLDWFVSVFGEQVRDLIVIVDGGYHNYGNTRPFSKAADFLQYDTWRNDKNQGVFFFIDECHLAMPVGGTDKALKEYLSMHRHYGHDIMLLTQNFRKVDRDVKDMIQTAYLCTKLSFLGKDDAYVCKVADGVSRNIVHTHQREYESKYFKAYQSHTKSQGSVKEQETSGVKKWYQRWTTYGFIGCMFFGLFIIGATLASSDKKTIAESKPLLTNPAPNSQPADALNPFKPVTSSVLAIKPPESQEKPKSKPKNTNHPFSGLSIHLSGYYADNDNRGRFNKTYYFALSRNGQYISELTAVDLQLAGYQVRIYNACAAEIIYDDYQAFVLCDTPTQSVGGAPDALSMATN